MDVTSSRKCPITPERLLRVSFCFVDSGSSSPRHENTGAHVRPAPCQASLLSIYSALPFSCSFPPPIPSLSSPPSPSFSALGTHLSTSHLTRSSHVLSTQFPAWLTRLFAQSRADSSSSRATSVRADHVWSRDGCTMLRLQTNKQELIHSSQGWQNQSTGLNKIKEIKNEDSSKFTK